MLFCSDNPQVGQYRHVVISFIDFNLFKYINIYLKLEFYIHYISLTQAQQFHHYYPILTFNLQIDEFSFFTIISSIHDSYCTGLSKRK